MTEIIGLYNGFFIYCNPRQTFYFWTTDAYGLDLAWCLVLCCEIFERKQLTVCGNLYQNMCSIAFTILSSFVSNPVQGPISLLLDTRKSLDGIEEILPIQDKCYKKVHVFLTTTLYVICMGGLSECDLFVLASLNPADHMPTE